MKTTSESSRWKRSLKGVCTKSNFLDLFENFILFDDSGGTVSKVVAQNQQYLGVNRATSFT